MASQSSRPLDIAVESLEGLVREIKSRTINEDQRKRVALKLRDVVAVCHRGMSLYPLPISCLVLSN